MPCYVPSSLNSLDRDAHLHVALVRVGDERADAGEVHGGAVLVALRREAPCGWIVGMVTCVRWIHQVCIWGYHMVIWWPLTKQYTHRHKKAHTHARTTTTTTTTSRRGRLRLREFPRHGAAQDEETGGVQRVVHDVDFEKDFAADDLFKSFVWRVRGICAWWATHNGAWELKTPVNAPGD